MLSPQNPHPPPLKRVFPAQTRLRKALYWLARNSLSPQKYIRFSKNPLLERELHDLDTSARFCGWRRCPDQNTVDCFPSATKVPAQCEHDEQGGEFSRAWQM